MSVPDAAPRLAKYRRKATQVHFRLKEGVRFGLRTDVRRAITNPSWTPNKKGAAKPLLSQPIAKKAQSNLREGANTMASPISTFFPSTEQWQSSLTRRLPISMSTTFTSA